MHEQLSGMDQTDALASFVNGAQVDDAVFELRPDYRVMLLAVDGIEPHPSDQKSETMLRAAEAAAAHALETTPVTEVPHVAAWRDAYRAFGVKPQRVRNSLESLMRRAATGLPRVNRLTDVYNAVSVLHQIPLGGENLLHYQGAPRLQRASGTERFDVVSSGEVVIEHPEPGEVVWCDDAGVTCRNWNWRQCVRTALTDDTTTAIFILDALKPLDDEALVAGTVALADALSELGSNVRFASRLIGAA